MQRAKSRMRGRSGWLGARKWPICQAYKFQAVPLKPGCWALSPSNAFVCGDYFRQGASSGVEQTKGLAGAKGEVALGAGFGGARSGAPESPGANHSPQYCTHPNQASWHHALFTSSSTAYQRLIAASYTTLFPCLSHSCMFCSTCHMICCASLREFTTWIYPFLMHIDQHR